MFNYSILWVIINVKLRFNKFRISLCFLTKSCFSLHYILCQGSLETLKEILITIVSHSVLEF